jgi:hypothetical protein
MYIKTYEGTFEVDSVEAGSEATINFNGNEYIIFESVEEAGQAARAYWESMAEDDPQEFTAMVGEFTLVSWASGQYAGPGSAQVTSLNDWLDLWLDTPEEHFARYDGEEIEVERISPRLADELGFTFDCNDCEAVIYRTD